MPRSRIDIWLTGAGSIAVKMPLRELGGPLVRRFQVPMETVLFVRTADGQQRAHRSGEDVDTRQNAVALLVKTPRIEIPFEFDALDTKSENHWADSVCQLAVRAVPKPSELASLLDRAVGDADELTVTDLRDLIETPCRACLTAYCRDVGHRTLADRDHTADVESALREALAKVAFTYGLEFLGLDRLGLKSRRKGRPKRVIVERARQFVIATGRQVLVFDPMSADTPRPAYEFSGELGPLRSVRILTLEGQRHVAGGARDGVYLISAGAGDAALTYPLPSRTQGRTGVNAVAAHDGRLFATHAEHGLTEWDLNAPGQPGRPVLPDLTAGARACRQVQVTDAGRLVFSVDNTVVSADLANPAATPVIYRGAAGEIATIWCAPDAMFAGTNRGAVLRWSHDAPEADEVVLRKGHAVYGLKPVYLDGILHLAVGARDYAVTALRLDDLTETLFRSPRWQVRFVAGASDFLAGIDAQRATMLVWDTASPARPAHTVPIRPVTGHSVQDLACWRETAGKGKA